MVLISCQPSCKSVVPETPTAGRTAGHDEHQLAQDKREGESVELLHRQLTSTGSSQLHNTRH